MITTTKNKSGKVNKNENKFGKMKNKSGKMKKIHIFFSNVRSFIL